MLNFILGMSLGVMLGIIWAAILTSGKIEDMRDEARLAYKEGYRVGKSER